MRFAENLLQSSQFIHMCDDFFSDELNNLIQVTAILQGRGEISDEDRNDRLRKLQTELNLGDYTKDQPDPPVVLDIRLPSDGMRVMLFDHVFHLIEKNLKKLKKVHKSSEMEKHQEVIELIKKYYPIKLKGAYRKFRQQDQKMMQQNFEKNISRAS
mmetsp:Transcript_7347/g.6573  ORF Transcript_7347/g.6573 Transcript_7347/m.6573 type:complete len:156 (-) Transcript_7347:176-643(-)